MFGAQVGIETNRMAHKIVYSAEGLDPPRSRRRLIIETDTSEAHTTASDFRDGLATTGQRFAVTRWWSGVDSNYRFRLFKRK